MIGLKKELPREGKTSHIRMKVMFRQYCISWTRYKRKIRKNTQI